MSVSKVSAKRICFKKKKKKEKVQIKNPKQKDTSNDYSIDSHGFSEPLFTYAWFFIQ